MSSFASTEELLRQLTGELDNFEQIAQYLLPQPGDLPRVQGVDVFGGTLALNGTIGGDHLIYVDFKQRFNLPARIEHAVSHGRGDIADRLRRRQQMAGIVLIDVSGHRVTDALLAAMLHQAFLLGAIYELDMFGRITRRLFENLNTRLYKSSDAHKFVSMIYGEISEDARFRFLSAGQPPPAVFSNEHDRFCDVELTEVATAPPQGEMRLLLVFVDRDNDLLEKGPQQFLAIAVRRGRCRPHALEITSSVRMACRSSGCRIRGRARSQRSRSASAAWRVWRHRSRPASC